MVAGMYLKHGNSKKALAHQLKLIKLISSCLSGGVFDSRINFSKNKLIFIYILSV